MNNKTTSTNRTHEEYIEVRIAPGLVQQVRIRNPLTEETMHIEDILLMIDEKTKEFITDRLKQLYIDSTTCDYPIWSQFLCATYMKLAKIKFIKVLYRRLIADGFALAKKFGFVDKQGEPNMMSYQNLWLFLKKRLYPNAIDSLSEYVLKQINERMKLFDMEFCKNIAHDGIAIRSHDRGAKYNDHYGFNMYKGEMGVDTDHLIPISFESAEGTDYDGHFVIPFAETLDRIEKKPRNGTFDGHYTGLKNFAFLNQKHRITTIMNIPEDQRKVVDAGSLKEINRLYQKFHQHEDFKVGADLECKLQFLFDRERIDEVGYYYRNRYVREWKRDKEAYKKRYNQRSLDETLNNMVKNGLVDVENASNGTGLNNRHQHGKLCILAIQLVVLIRLQHGITENLTSVQNIAC